MKPKITRAGLLNEINNDFMINSSSSSGVDGSLHAHNQFNFTDLYLSDSRGDSGQTSHANTQNGRSDIEAFRKVNIRITVLTYKGFFKGFHLCIGYINADGSNHEKHFPIDEKLLAVADLEIKNILDLTQVCVSVRSKRGHPLKISLSADGKTTAEEVKVDLSSLDELTVFVNDHLQEKNETKLPIGWISYNTPNILY